MSAMLRTRDSNHNDLETIDMAYAHSTAMGHRTTTVGPSEAATKQHRGILSVKMADAILDWFIFPALLYIQFGVTIYCQHQRQLDNKTAPPPSDLAWVFPIFVTITAFCVVAIGYRKVYRHHTTISSLALLLLPEVFTNVVLCAVMVVDVTAAFGVLLALTALLAAMAAVGFCRQRRSCRSHPPMSDPTDYKRLIHPEDWDGMEAVEPDDGDDDEWLC
jgi:hypothetical protein